MSDATIYSPLKVFHHRTALSCLQAGEHIAPIRVQLIPTNRCSHNCRGCAYRTEGYPSSETFAAQDELSWDKLKEIVTDCKDMGVKAVEITGGGEPTMHPKFLNLCALILSKGINLAVVTNGSIWSREHTAILSQAQWVRFSIDAGCESTYIRYHGAKTGAYEKTRDNLRQLTSAKRGKDLLVGVGFVVNEMNWREVRQATKNAREDGADNIRISALFQPRGTDYFKDFYGDAKELCREASLLSTPGFRVFNLFGDRLDDLLQEAPDYSYCGYARLTTYLGADYNAYLCCMNAYNKYGILGTFQHQSFQKMWNSQKTVDRLFSLDARLCLHCMYNNKNASIAYGIDPDPPHVNFI